ncbi:MAG: 3',5'-cyclic nucleotide phosphodiesterase [Candidatus Lambdaproteobacteria bacterium]|nr:3',5'-cyclic nucleotide phosphodiesterase [Candidatus Lambdaproteobacteria bacterium]
MEFDLTLPILSIRSHSELEELMASIFQWEGSARRVGVKPKALRSFTHRVAQQYHANPYHNLNHAVDTCNTMGWLITRPVFHKNLSDWERFLLLVSALVHDVDHPGHDNQWEIKTRSPLARKFNNVSVLENNSVEVTNAFLDDPQLNIFAALGGKAEKDARHKIAMLVLATDFSRHQDFLDRLDAAILASRTRFNDRRFLELITGSLIKAADIANTTKPFHLARFWGARVMQEFWRQGEREKAQHLEVGPLNDPDSMDVNAAQAGFIKFACMGLFELLCKIDGDIAEMLGNLHRNVHEYEQRVAPNHK